MTSGYQNSVKTEKKNGSPPWGLVIFLLFIFWPVGVFFLVKKLSTDKKASLSSGRTMMIWGWIIAGGGIISWTSMIQDGFWDGTLGTLFFVSAGLVLVYIGKRSSVRAAKYKHYIDIIINKRMRSIATIASSIPVPHEEAITDIQEMIKKGFFEDAYINHNQDEIVLLNSDELNTQVHPHLVASHKAEMIVAACNGCGANNKVVKGAVENCQYCGSLISG